MNKDLLSFRNMQPPRYKNGVWTVVAQPPEGKKENTFVYEAGKFVITIRKWQKPKTITQDRWTSYGSSWITGKDNQHADTQIKWLIVMTKTAKSKSCHQESQG